MRKEDLERRCAEMKARMLAQRPKPIFEELPAVPKELPKALGRNSATGSKRPLGASVSEAPKGDEVAALKGQVASLEAENRKLRDQIAGLGSRSVIATPPSRSGDDKVREQQHNYFKYSNARRY